eukprot:TRINITY_DN1982_c0_g2_i2.p1 TRINITY_DN1982_c0_g2~~TRINITY_DN1982_c0_g2_i2.p1  ORF type:complete len:191 (+),score=29.98 TRINITY_DN1982_c0_g2_i2:398-970(+)
MRGWFVFLIFVVVCFLGVVVRSKCPSVDTVDLQLPKYLGGWYEIAVSPLPRDTFEKDCTCTHANYSLQDDGKIEVNNTCNLGSPQGTFDVAIGSAYVPDPSQPGKLKVQFSSNPFAQGDYWVIDIDQNYTVSIVWSCGPVLSLEFLWILSRTPTIPDTLYKEVAQKAQNLTGFDVSKLWKTQQIGCPQWG